MNKKGGDLICIRPDSIVEARFKLTKKQNDIMDMVFANINDDDKLEYEIDLRKYVELYNVKDKSDIYGELKKAVKSFEGKGFRLTSKENDREDYFSWFSRISYLNGEGRIIVELGYTLKKLLLEVKRATFYNIQYSLNFNSIYSKRLYYYLKLYEDTGIRIDNIDILRSKLECPKGYKNFADFNRYVLTPAYEEINGNSDIEFEFERIKTGRKVTSIKFFIKANKKVNAPKEISVDIDTTKDDIIKLVRLMKDHKIAYSEAESIYRDGKGNLEHIAKIYEHFKYKKADSSFVGLIRKMVRPGKFNEPKQSQNKTSFNNFEPREYDYDKLERKLLGWD